MMYVANIGSIDQYSNKSYAGPTTLKRTFHDNIDHKVLFLNSVSFVSYEQVLSGNVQRETYTF